MLPSCRTSFLPKQPWDRNHERPVSPIALPFRAPLWHGGHIQPGLKTSLGTQVQSSGRGDGVAAGAQPEWDRHLEPYVIMGGSVSLITL